MDIKNLNITGLYLTAIHAVSVYRDKYACVLLSFENNSSITLITNEFDINGGEIYEIVLTEDFNKNLWKFKKIFGQNQKIHMQGIIRRDEWYEKIIDADCLGENPRSLNFKKPSAVTKNSKNIKTVNCGYIIKTDDCDILIITSDYPGCLEVITDRNEIDDYLKTAEVTYNNN